MEKTLNQLAKELYDTKQTEEQAKRKRIEVEEAIAALSRPKTVVVRQ